MQLEHSFVIPVEAEQAWQVLLDVERIAPCMPGATLLSVDGDEFTGQVKVKLGPINLTYKGSARFVEKDEAARRVVIEASGKESRGASTAKASVTAQLSPANAGTTVSVVTDLAITGRPAQFGRGMLEDVGGRLVDQFATCLAETLQADSQPIAATPTASPDTEAATPATSATTLGETTDVGSPANAASTAEATTRTTAAPGTAASERAERARQSNEDDAIDLLQVTGVSALVTRYRTQLVVGAIVAIVLLWLLRRLTRR